MDKEEKELLEKYRHLIPANKASAMSVFQVAYAVQENTKCLCGLQPGSVPAQSVLVAERTG